MLNKKVRTDTHMCTMSNGGMVRLIDGHVYYCSIKIDHEIFENNQDWTTSHNIILPSDQDLDFLPCLPQPLSRSSSDGQRSNSIWPNTYNLLLQTPHPSSAGQWRHFPSHSHLPFHPQLQIARKERKQWNTREVDEVVVSMSLRLVNSRREKYLDCHPEVSYEVVENIPNGHPLLRRACHRILRQMDS